MEATLEGQDINVCIRTSNVPGGELKCWPDSLVDDYIHRPLQKEFEDICFYDMTSQYKKIYKSHKPKSIQTYEFSDSHPRDKLSHLSKLKHSTIPRKALPQNKLCSLEELEFKHTNSAEKSDDKQEMYAKMALLIFYPYQKLNNLTDDGSYWKKIIFKNCNAIFSKNTQNSVKRVLKYFKIQKTGQPYKNMSNVLETQFQWQPLTKSQIRLKETRQIFQTLIRWWTYLRLAYD